MFSKEFVCINREKKKRKERKGWIKLEKINFTYLLGFLFGD